MSPVTNPKTRSGANIPETQRSTVQRKLRISPEADAKLDKLAAVAGVPASRVVEAMIDLEHDAMKPKRKRASAPSRRVPRRS